MARKLTLFGWLLAAVCAVWAESASAYRAELGSKLLQQDVELPGPGRSGPVKLHDLVGAALENRHGDRIGRIDELVVDLAAQRIDYAVVRFDESWLGTSKRAAVPLRALVGRSSGPDSWVIDADPARAISLPEFDRADLRRINDSAVVDQVHAALQRSPWMRTSRSQLELGGD